MKLIPALKIISIKIIDSFKHKFINNLLLFSLFEISSKIFNMNFIKYS